VRSGQDEELKSLRAKLTELESELAIKRSRFTDNNPALLTLIEQRDATVPSTLKNIEPDGQQYSGQSPGQCNIRRVSQALATQLILEIELSAGKLAVVRSERVNLKAREETEGAGSCCTTRQREAASSLELLQRKLEEARIAEAQLISNLRIIGAEPPAFT